MQPSGLPQDWIDPPGPQSGRDRRRIRHDVGEQVFRGRCPMIPSRRSSGGLRAAATRQALQQADCASGRRLLREFGTPLAGARWWVRQGLNL